MHRIEFDFEVGEGKEVADEGEIKTGLEYVEVVLDGEDKGG
jgi:hypothetical protein